MSEPRPERYDPAVIAAAAQALLPRVLAWLHDKDENPEEVLACLVQMLEDAPGSEDGYHLARWLEDYHYWEPDAELVDILEAALSIWYTAHRAAIKAWVARTQPQAVLQVGARVDWSKAGQPARGTIRAVWPEMGEYEVVEDGDQERTVTTRGKRQTIPPPGYLVAWEDARPAPQEEQSA